MNDHLAAAAAFTLLFAGARGASAQPHFAAAGIAEAATAFHYTERAFDADNTDSARIDLQAAINCLVGPGDRGVSAAARNPCAGQGKGAIRDIGNGSLREQLHLALNEATLGLKSADLASAGMHALSAMDYMQAVREAWLFPAAGGATAPSHNHHRAVVRLRPGEIRVSQLIGAAVKNSAGQAVGTITDLVLDTELHVVRLVGLKPIESNSRVLSFRWSQLDLSPPASRPATGYVSSLQTDAVAAAPQYADEALARPSYIDVESNLVGRPVVAADGEKVGKLIDLVIELRSGAVDYILMSGNSVLGGPKSPRSLRWASIADLRIEHDIVLNLDERQLAAAPVFLSK